MNVSAQTAWNRLKGGVYDKWRQYWIQKHPTQIGERSWKAIFENRGKEIRPNLCCEIYTILQSPSALQTLGPESVAELAFAIECIHIASLILDDTPFMDNSDMRRNKPAIHRQFSIMQSLVFSYEIFEMIQQIWVQNRPEHISTEDWWGFLKTKLIQLAIGQIHDLQSTGDIYTLAVMKTGTLFEFASELPAYILGGPVEYWRTWGRIVGILFQWADDWEDREDDRIHSTRNAFNEGQSIVASAYAELYKLVCGDSLVQKNAYIISFLECLNIIAEFGQEQISIYSSQQIPISVYEPNPTRKYIQMLISEHAYGVQQQQQQQQQLYHEIYERLTRHVSVETDVRDTLSFSVIHRILKKLVLSSNYTIDFDTSILWGCDESLWKNIILQKVLSY